MSLTVTEVVNCPSMVARLIEAYHTMRVRIELETWYVHLLSFQIEIELNYSFNFREVLRKSIHDGLLAPTTAQRRKFAEKLWVYGKEKATIPVRLKKLIEDYNVSLPLIF